MRTLRQMVDFYETSFNNGTAFEILDLCTAALCSF